MVAGRPDDPLVIAPVQPLQTDAALILGLWLLHQPIPIVVAQEQQTPGDEEPASQPSLEVDDQ